MREKGFPFFRTLAGSRSSENYLSRAFQACFTQSTVFAQCILSLMWTTCRLDEKVPDAANWVCDYQPATPAGGKIRPDLCLRTFLKSNERSEHKPIFIESKIGARLGEQQLKNYVESGTEVLVAVTKNWPEVHRARLSSIGINHIRWQDVARSLATVSTRSGKDRFLCNAFVEFLEYSNMTYREDISIHKLEEVRALLARIGKPKYLHFVPGAAFEIADSCIAMLRDVRRIAHERMPRLTKCSNWGPGYYHLQNDEDETLIDWHVLGMEMYVKGKYSKSRLLCGLYFSSEKKKDIHWLVAHRGSNASPDHEEWSAVSKYLSRKKLDAELLAKSIVQTVNKWKIL